MNDALVKENAWVNAMSKGTGGVIILGVIIIVSVLLYGAVDTGTLALLSVLSFALIIYWTWISWRSGQFAIELNIVQLPVIALGVVGLIQLLPLRTVNVPSGVLDIAAVASLSLDPYSTRFFLMRLFLYIIFFAAALTFINSISRLRLIVVTLITFGGLIAFYSILQRVEDPSSIYGLRQPGQAIPFGTFINRHHFAALMEMTIGLSLGVVFAGGISRNRWPFIVAAAIVMAIAIVLTGSRGGVIGLVTAHCDRCVYCLRPQRTTRAAQRRNIFAEAHPRGWRRFCGHYDIPGFIFGRCRPASSRNGSEWRDRRFHERTDRFLAYCH